MRIQQSNALPQNPDSWLPLPTGGYSTGYAHDPEEQAKYTDRTGNEGV